MQKQIVKINDRYAARMRRNRFCRWTYLGRYWKGKHLYGIHEYCLFDTIEEANERFDWFERKFDVVINK